MSVFGDTSALYPLLVKTEASHAATRATFAELLDSDRAIWTTSFVLVETMALLQHRIGLPAARDFDEEILPVLSIHWVDEDLYQRGVERLWREDRRRLSLVDCVGFEFMKLKGLTTAFTVDPHFKQAGFKVLPAGP
jgi:predicted nucleic acid-binding protein